MPLMFRLFSAQKNVFQRALFGTLLRAATLRARGGGMNRAAARFKNEAPLRFSRGNLPRDPAAGLRTAFAVRKYAVKSADEKEMIPADQSRN